MFCYWIKNIHQPSWHNYVFISCKIAFQFNLLLYLLFFIVCNFARVKVQLRFFAPSTCKLWQRLYKKVLNLLILTILLIEQLNNVCSYVMLRSQNLNNSAYNESNLQLVYTSVLNFLNYFRSSPDINILRIKVVTGLYILYIYF